MQTIGVKFIRSLFFVSCFKFLIEARQNLLLISKQAESINKNTPLRILLKSCPNTDAFTCKSLVQRNSDFICMECNLNKTNCPCFFTEDNKYIIRQQSSEEISLTKSTRSTHSHSHEISSLSINSTTTFGTTTKEIKEDSKEELESNYAITLVAPIKNSENHFGLIIGISLTSVVFLVLILVFLVIILMKNYRKAKDLKKQKQNLELDLKLKQTTISSIISTPTSSLTPLTEFSNIIDIQPSSSPQPLPSFDSMTQSPQTNDENYGVDIYLDVDENNLISCDGLVNKNQSNDKLPTYNSLFTHISNSI